ncbi:hypothetical protein D3C79_466630 [compost metagenome]
MAFLLNQPQIIHCFSTDVAQAANAAKRKGAHAEFIGIDQPMPQHGAFTARVRIVGDDGRPRLGLDDLTLRYFLAPSSMPRNLPLTEVGEGVYQASLQLPEAGAWYLHVQSPSLGRKFAEENYTSLRVLPAAASNAAQGESSPLDSRSVR